MTPRRCAFLIVFCVCLPGCAHSPARPQAVAAGTAAADAPPPRSREQLLMAAGKRPKAEAKPGRDDDFVDVDDRGALRKTWPMALFLALLAAACGAF